MKKLLLNLLCIPIIGFGQNVNIPGNSEINSNEDNVSLNLNKDLTNHLKIQDEINKINFKMERHHKQFFTGGVINIIGLGLISLGNIINKNDAKAASNIIYVGGGFSLIGTIISVSSHKWFKKNPVGVNKKKTEIEKLIILNKNKLFEKEKSEIDKYKKIDKWGRKYELDNK
tara:strand:- start:78 stop:593 length:516 start_codon:yes stop_codon:yes gene_type:complete